jgi:hypothetical protein
MAKISQLPILTNPDTLTRFLALDVTTSPYTSKTVTISDLRDKIISLGVITIGPTLVQNSEGSFDVATPIPTQTGHQNEFLTTDGNSLSWSALDSTFPVQVGNSGKYLTTDGNTVSWGSITKIPEQVSHAGQYLTTNGTTVSWGSLSLSSLTNVVLSSPTTGQVLTYNGTNWINSTTVSTAIGVTNISAGTGTAVSASTGSITIWSTGAGSNTVITAGTGTAVSASTGNITIWSTVSGGSGGTVSRATFSTSTSVIGAAASAATVIVGAYRGYALLSIQTSAAAWVTVYSNAAAQTTDSSRGITTDPTPGSGVIAEAITTQAGTVTFTPAVIGFNNEASPTTSIPLRIYNNTGGSSAITVTLTLLKLED